MVGLHGTCLSACSGADTACFPLLSRPPGSPVQLQAEPRSEQAGGEGSEAAAVSLRL